MCCALEQDAYYLIWPNPRWLVFSRMQPIWKEIASTAPDHSSMTMRSLLALSFLFSLICLGSIGDCAKHDEPRGEVYLSSESATVFSFLA